MKTINECKIVPVKYECDVLVAGGGVAGIAASLAAAERGASVILCEKEFAVGGLATLGLITFYLTLCDGEGTQISYSIAEELMRMSLKYGKYDTSSDPWFSDASIEGRKKKRFEVDFNAFTFAYMAEELLLSKGVKILYGTSVCAVDVQDGKIKHIIIENKSGRQAVSTGSVVDCTGDADVCAAAGEDTAVYSDGNIQAAWYYSLCEGKLALHPHGASDKPTPENENTASFKYTGFSGLDAEENSMVVIDAHRHVMEDFAKKHNENKDTEITLAPTIPQIRMTRRIVGAGEIKKEHDHKHFSDSIGMICNWRKRGEVYEIPFSCLYGRKIKNLIAAGRCISTSDEMWDATRVIAACAVTGQAAGTAASMSDDFANTDTAALQTALSERGVKLFINELFPDYKAEKVW